MKSSLLRLLRPFRPLTSVLLMGAVLLFAGCETTKSAVDDTVGSSNAAMLEARLGPLPEKDGAPPALRWEQANEEIEAFIRQHPTPPSLVAPLRLRQALILLANRQPGLASAAFEAVNESDLHTDRDRALKANADHLLWWFSTSASATWTAADQAKAEKALRDLAATQLTLARSPEIRDYLAELRAWIGLAAAKQTTSAAKARARLEDALNGYAPIFSAEDLAALKNPSTTAASSTVDADTRRRLRARAVLQAAKKQNREDSLGARPENPTFAALIAP